MLIIKIRIKLNSHPCKFEKKKNRKNKTKFEIRNEKNANSFNQQGNGQFALFGCHK